MHTCHSPARHTPSTWRRTTAVTSVVLPTRLPADSATPLAQALRVGHRTHCTHTPQALRHIGRKPSASTPDDVALQPATDVAAHVAPDVADDVSHYLRTFTAGYGGECAQRHQQVSGWVAQTFRTLSANSTASVPGALRNTCAVLEHRLRSICRLLSAYGAQALRLHSGNTPGVSSIQLRILGGRLPHMMRKVAGIPAAESAVSHRMTVAISTATTTAMQAVIL